MDNDKYIGRLLDGRYEILEVIGTGGMAVVYKARCHRLNRLVAVKILKDEFSQDEDFRRRFQAESQAVAMLSHPNIVSVYDVSTYGDADFIVMELIEGISLKQYMEKKGVLNWKETLHFSMQIAKALEHAHGRGIVHRDIKPHNVMVLKNGSVKVADFGIAQVTSSGATMTKEALGSVHYISPEQAKGGRVDNRSDLYSLGIVMYEMIAGRVPFDGDTPVSVAIQHINGGAVAPSYWNPNIPKGLEQIVMRSIARLPRDRYASATAMLYDMDEFRKDPLVVFPDPIPVEKEATQVIPNDVEQQAERAAQRTVAERTAMEKNRQRRQPPPDEPEERNRVATIAIASCVVVGIIAIIIFLVLMGQGSEPETLIQVPNLVGAQYDELPAYTDIQVIVQKRENNNEFAAGQIIHQSPKAGEQVKSGTQVFVTVSLGPNSGTMLDLTDRDEDTAEQILENMDLDLNIKIVPVKSEEVAEGRVIRTVPVEGATLTRGQTVTIYVSSGGSTTAKLPDVTGMDRDAATERLYDAGFKNIKYIEEISDQPEGTVFNQSPKGGNGLIDKTTLIKLYIAKPEPETTEPETVVPEAPEEPEEPVEGDQTANE